MRVTPFAGALTDAQLQAIGMVAVESAWLERLVESYIQRFARLNRKKTDAFLKGRMMAAKVELLALLGRSAIKSPQGRDEFAQLIQRCSDANARRNRVIHGLWSKRTKESAASAVKRGRRGNVERMSANDIEQVANDLASAFWLCLYFFEQHAPTAAQRRDATLLRQDREARNS